MLYKRNPQLNKNGELIHLLSIEGLPKSILTHILDTAANFTSVSDREVKKVPLLRGKSVFNLFFENSTRTRTTFEIAAKRLSADVINLDIARSSASKGESLLDTIANLSAMAADLFVVRHSESGAPYLIAQHVAPHVHVVNAGDGRHAHPTQGLLDMYTIRHFKKDFTQLSVAIVGDIVHSRVARSDIHALTTLGVPDIRAVGPKTLVPGDFKGMGVRVWLPEQRKWADHWTAAADGVVNPPQLGSFIGGAGLFLADDTDDGKPVKIRAVWDRITPTSCRWYQCMSKDDGATWEYGWYMDWTRVG